MGAEAMKITVVGAVLIIAGAIVVVLAIQALSKSQNGGSGKDRQGNGSEG
jgi:hypothetical protein